MADCTRVVHLTLKVTFACVDKSVFHSRFVERALSYSGSLTDCNEDKVWHGISSNEV